MSDQGYYSILGINSSATEEEIRQQFMNISNNFTFNLEQNQADKKRILLAFWTLIDLKRRTQYDIDQAFKKAKSFDENTINNKKESLKKVVLDSFQAIIYLFKNYSLSFLISSIYFYELTNCGWLDIGSVNIISILIFLYFYAYLVMADVFKKY